MPELTYPEVGATAGELPPGYHHVRETRVVGRGRAEFARASEAVLTWQMHDRAGVHQRSGPPRAAVGADVSFTWLLLRFECRVVSVVDEDDRCGFAYGTLPRHPERGEERFMVEHDAATDAVTATITAFSKPASAAIRLAGPAARLVQARMTRRYLTSLL